MKKKPISEETQTAILEATWALIAKHKRLDVGQAEIAAAAGVSRQTVYLAFGNRAGLLTAMVRHRDTRSDHVTRLGEISRARNISLQDFHTYLDIWIEYLQLIYPVGILLDAAALTDTDAASAWDDRMKGGLLAGLKRIFVQLAKKRRVEARLECRAGSATDLESVATAERSTVDGQLWLERGGIPPLPARPYSIDTADRKMEIRGLTLQAGGMMRRARNGGRAACPPQRRRTETLIEPVPPSPRLILMGAVFAPAWARPAGGIHADDHQQPCHRPAW